MAIESRATETASEGQRSRRRCRRCPCCARRARFFTTRRTTRASGATRGPSASTRTTASSPSSFRCLTLTLSLSLSLGLQCSRPRHFQQSALPTLGALALVPLRSTCVTPSNHPLPPQDESGGLEVQNLTAPSGGVWVDVPPVPNRSRYPLCYRMLSSLCLPCLLLQLCLAPYFVVFSSFHCTPTLLAWW